MPQGTLRGLSQALCQRQGFASRCAAPFHNTGGEAGPLVSTPQNPPISQSCGQPPRRQTMWEIVFSAKDGGRVGGRALLRTEAQGTCVSFPLKT